MEMSDSRTQMKWNGWVTNESFFTTFNKYVIIEEFSLPSNIHSIGVDCSEYTNDPL